MEEHVVHFLVPGVTHGAPGPEHGDCSPPLREVARRHAVVGEGGQDFALDVRPLVLVLVDHGKHGQLRDEEVFHPQVGVDALPPDILDRVDRALGGVLPDIG